MRMYRCENIRNNVDKKIYPFLSGKRFSVAVIFPHEKNRDYSTRVEKLLKIIKSTSQNRNIIHLGCCDHKKLISTRIRKHEWLQQILEENAENVLGIDINKEAIDYCRNELGKNNMFCYDMISDVKEVRELLEKDKIHWSYLVAGEMLEHVDNPVDFLKHISDNYSDLINKIIITVPNAFSYENFKAAWNNMEIINSDHRYSFTPYTISKVLTRAGFHVEQVYVTNHTNLLCRFFGKNMMGQTLVATASFSKSEK